MAEELITQFKVTYFQHPKAGKIAIMTMDNGADYKKPNTFGQGAIDSLNEAMDNLDKDIKGLMLTGKTFIFSVGANLMEVPAIKSVAEGKEVGTSGHAAFKRIMDLKVPTLAAINGARSIRANRSASPSRADLTTSAMPAANSRGGSVASRSVATNTPRGW